MEKGQVNAHEMRTAIYQALEILEEPHRARQAMSRIAVAHQDAPNLDPAKSQVVGNPR